MSDRYLELADRLRDMTNRAHAAEIESVRLRIGVERLRAATTIEEADSGRCDCCGKLLS